MTIKSDKWIRRMAENRRMIEPFEPGQIKEVNGKRVLRLTNFKTSNGPDVHVYLVAAPDAYLQPAGALGP